MHARWTSSRTSSALWYSKAESPRALPSTRSTFQPGRASPTPGDPIFVTGTVVDLKGRPVEGALVDVWNTSAEGLYENEYVKSDGRWLIRRLWWNPTLYWPLPGFDRARFRSLGVSEQFPPTEARDTPPPRVLPFHYPHPVTGEPIVVDFLAF